MNYDIIETIMTAEVLNNTSAKALIKRHLENPKSLEDENLYSNLVEELNKIQVKSDVKLIKPIKDYIEESLVPIKTYILLDDSPFKVLDNPQTMLLRNGLITIGAKANTGKTSLATHLALEIMKANEKTCFVFFSLDDSRTLGIKRILSQITKTSYMKTTKTAPLDPETQDLFNNFSNDIFIIEENNSLEYIKPSIDSIKQLGNYQNVIVCIDYLQIIDSSKPVYGVDKRNFLNAGLKEIKQIQKATNSFFMILSQLKRDGKGTDFEYRETSEIENVSDVCIDLEYDNKIEGSKSSPDRIIKISKNKIGIKGQVFTTTINECFLFSDLTPETNFTGNQLTQYFKKQDVTDKWVRAREKTSFKKS